MEQEQKKDTREPQLVQRSFPEFEQLKSDMISKNQKLIRYRQMMYKLATGHEESQIDIEGTEHSSVSK